MTCESARCWLSCRTSQVCRLAKDKRVRSLVFISGQAGHIKPHGCLVGKHLPGKNYTYGIVKVSATRKPCCRSETARCRYKCWYGVCRHYKQLFDSNIAKNIINEHFSILIMNAISTWNRFTLYGPCMKQASLCIRPIISAKSELELEYLWLQIKHAQDPTCE